MKKIFLYAMIITAIIPIHADYVHFGHRLEKNISIPGYPVFDYAFWLHPGQGNNELQTLFTKSVLDFLKKIIPEGSVVIDIGAHAGDTSVAYSLVVGTSGTVLAFEPNPATFQVLQVNARNNPTIIPIPKAITEKEGNYTFHYTDIGLNNGAYADMLSVHPYRIPVAVQGVNLEQWLEKNVPNLISKISFIKIDTEGYDRYILKSIKNLLLSYRPIVQCELFVYLNAAEKEDLFKTLDALNYVMVLSAYEGKIDTSPIKHRTVFNKSSFIQYQIPEYSADVLCIPKEKYTLFI